MARPPEVIQEAQHCSARNQVETMSEDSAVLVKVSSARRIVLRTAATGHRLCDLLGSASVGAALPTPHGGSRLPPRRAPTLLRAPRDWLSLSLQPAGVLTSPPASRSLPISQIGKLRLRTGRGPKYWSFSFSISPPNEYSGLVSFRMDWLDLLAVQGTLKSLLQHHSSKASILQHSAFFIVQLSHPYMTDCCCCC